MMRFILTTFAILICSCSKKSANPDQQFYQGIAQTGTAGTTNFSADTFFINLTKNGAEYSGETTYKMEQGNFRELKGTKTFKEKVLILYAFDLGKKSSSPLFKLKKSGKKWKGFVANTPFPNWETDTLTSVTLIPYTFSKTNILKKAQGTYHLSEMRGVAPTSSDFYLFPIDTSWYGSITKVETNGVREGYEPQFTKSDRAVLTSCRIEISEPNSVNCFLGGDSNSYSKTFSARSDSLRIFQYQLAFSSFDTVDLAQLMGISAVTLPSKGVLHVTYLHSAEMFKLEHTTTDGSTTILTFQKSGK